MAAKTESDETTLAAIHRLLDEFHETNDRIKAMRDNLKDVLLQNQEYQEIQEELKEMTAKRQQAKKLLEVDRDYQTIHSELEELKFKKNDLAEIMSHHLVTYYNETGETALRDQDGEVRQLLLTAKIGKPEAVIGGETIPSPRRKKGQLPGQVTLESQIQGYGKPGGGK